MFTFIVYAYIESDDERERKGEWEKGENICNLLFKGIQIMILFITPTYYESKHKQGNKEGHIRCIIALVRYLLGN